PSAALSSAKLAALHARLALSKKIPLQTLARCLITPSADQDRRFNNANLALLGSTIVNYHAFEYIICKWPRLPQSVLFNALGAYSGKDSLTQVSKRWGVEEAAAPGKEVDAGLLQWSVKQRDAVDTQWAHTRAENERGDIEYRRGMSSRVVLDDAFGDEMPSVKQGQSPEQHLAYSQSVAHSSFAQAVVGAIYAHCGRESAKAFVSSHILSRHLDPAELFQFKQPVRELSMLCAREGFEAPIARLESETGRLSRTPVFVVGIYSGKDKLGEGAGPSLNSARKMAAMNALKAWYVYSPGHKVRVPSDMMEEGAKPWTPPHIDIGEIV
ncbi:ribonuclease III, partial [Sarocladium strictum]